jgi:hypothetical protein
VPKYFSSQPGIRGGRARLVWEGEHLSHNMALAASKAINRVMADCVAQAKSNHQNKAARTGHPYSYSREDYWNQTGDLTNSIRIFDFATPRSVITGSWGSDSDHAIYVEIGTSEYGETVEERVATAHGDADAIPPPEGPLMAARHTWPEADSEGFLRPAADMHNRRLVGLVREEFKALGGGGRVHGIPNEFFGPFSISL